MKAFGVNQNWILVQAERYKMDVIKQLTLSELEPYIEHLSRHLPEPGVGGIYSQPFAHNEPIDKDSFRKKISSRWSQTPGVSNWEVAWGAFSNNKIVGHLELIGSSFAPISHRVKLGMGIEAAFRKQGLGKKLLSTALKWAKEQSCLDYIDLGVFSHNKVAIRLYEEFGFQRTGKIQDLIRIDHQVIHDFQYSLNLKSAFPPNFRLEICDRDQFYKIVGNMHKSIFDEDTICAWPEDFLSNFEREKLRDLNLNYQQNYTLHTLLFFQDELAGWSMGFQNTKESFLISNSAILPKFRGRSLYSNMQDEIIKVILSKGFQKIQSFHSLTNNAIILSKLKKGFVITGMEVNDLSGVLIQLTYFSNPRRSEIMDFRAGFKKPSHELKSILKI